MSEAPQTSTSSGPTSPQSVAVGTADAGVRLRPGLGVWLRDLFLSLAISAFIIVSVSYTHLDVYKRQLQGPGNLRPNSLRTPKAARGC